MQAGQSGLALFVTQVQQTSVQHQITKLNIQYEIDNLFDDDQQNDFYEYFIDAEDDNLSSAIDEFGDEFDEDDLRIYRIMFLSKVANQFFILSI